MPWANTYTGGLVVLTVAEDGTAGGRIVAESNFMWLREQRETWGAVKPTRGNGVADPERTDARVTTLHPYNATGPHGARVAIGQRVPGCQWWYWPWEPNEPVGVLWLVDPWGSWAKLTHTSPGAEEDEFPVLHGAAATVGRGGSSLPLVAGCGQPRSRPLAVHRHPGRTTDGVAPGGGRARRPTLLSSF